MKNILSALIFVFTFTALNAQSDFYGFTVKDIDGNDYALSQLQGKKVIVVNTASKCGLTPQYEGLEKLYNDYKDKNVVIIGFPANNFMKQEPGTNQEIKTFCSLNYGVSFPMMEKISVKGDDIHPLYQWLTQKSLNGKEDSSVKWNFQKYLINEQGELEKVVAPKTKPYSDEILGWLNNDA